MYRAYMLCAECMCVVCMYLVYGRIHIRIYVLYVCMCTSLRTCFCIAWVYMLMCVYMCVCVSMSACMYVPGVCAP